MIANKIPRKPLKSIHLATETITFPPPIRIFNLSLCRKFENTKQSARIIADTWTDNFDDRKWEWSLDKNNDCKQDSQETTQKYTLGDGNYHISSADPNFQLVLVSQIWKYKTKLKR